MSARPISVPDWTTWHLLAGAAVTVVSLGAWFGFTIDPLIILQCLAGVSVLVAAAVYYTNWRPDPLLATACSVFAFLLLFPVTILPLSYVTAAFNMPLQDAVMARLDRALGFDWQAVQHWTLAQPMLGRASMFAYANAHWAIVGAWVVLIATRQFERLREFALLTMNTAVIGIAIAALVPVAGAYAYYGVSSDMLTGMKGTGAGMWHVADFNAVRAGLLRVIDFGTMQGIVHFPSVHTVGAVTAAWALWQTPYLRWPLALFHAFVVFTAMPIGGHHLMDVLGGLALTALGLTLVRLPAGALGQVRMAALQWLPARWQTGLLAGRSAQ